MAPLVLARRIRANVTSLDDVGLLARVSLVMAVMPLLIRLPVPHLMRWLDAASTWLSVRDPERVARVVRYCRGLGGLHLWAFQDNCVARSLALFTLLNRRDAPLDVVFGVRATASPRGAVALGRRHVWLEMDGEPLFESESISDYVVSTRYRSGAVPAAAAVDPRRAAERRLMWSATVVGALAVGVTVLAGAARTKAVAVMLGPWALGLLGQQATLAVLLSYVASFGTSGGTTRFLSEAVAAGDTQGAGDVVRTSILVQGLACLVLVVLVGMFASPLASLAFGHPADARWLLWLLPAVPLTAVTAVSASVLRGHRLVGRHSAAQAGSALTALAIVAMLTTRREPMVVMVIPALVALASAVAMTGAAWPRLVAAWHSAPARVNRLLVRHIVSYGAANVAMAACTATATVVVGRLLLANGRGEALGHFYALTMGADVLLNLALGGYQAHYYPTFCAAADRPDASSVLGRLVRTAAGFTVPVLAITTIAAPIAVPLLLSARFLPIVDLVGPLVVGVYLRVLGAMLGIPLLARGHLAIVVGLHAAWSLSLVALFVWLGVDGGASSWVLAFAITAGLHVVVLTTVTHAWLRVRLGWGTLALALGGALLLVGLAQ